MKKTLIAILVCLGIFVSLPASVEAKSSGVINTLVAETNKDKITVKGTTSNDVVAAVAVVLDKNGKVVDMESFDVYEQSFKYTLDYSFADGKYTVKVADYDGGEFKIIDVTVGNIPTPTPTPKDESCEKVIGPTWHWNNKKGICEDTGVVKTYTR